MNSVVFDAELLRRYDRPGPRYTSYPAAPQFTTAFGAAQLREIEQLAPMIAARREVVQLHLGGGTPNFLGVDTLERLVTGIGRALKLNCDPQRDFSIELDQRTTLLLRNVAMCFDAYLERPRISGEGPEFSKAV